VAAAPEHGYASRTTRPYPAIGPHTVEDWLDLPPTVDGSRIELILGDLHVTSAPSGEHQYAASRLIRPLEDAVAAARQTGFYVVTAVGVRITTPFRTALVPDVVVLNQPPVGASFPAEALALAVEVWSPGNSLAERQFTMLGYAGAGVPFFWAVDRQGAHDGLRLTAYRLDKGAYREENALKPGEAAAVTASPVPITLDVADLTVY